MGTLVQAEGRASSKAQRMDHPWQAGGLARRPVWLEWVGKGEEWRGWGQRGVGGKGRDGQFVRTSQTTLRMFIFTQSELGPLEDFVQWIGHISSCLLTLSLWVPCGESKEDWGRSRETSLEAPAMIQAKDGWVAVMEVASSSSAWVYFEVCQQGVWRGPERKKGVVATQFVVWTPGGMELPLTETGRLEEEQGWGSISLTLIVKCPVMVSLAVQ